jgi:hypothetical protein
MQRIETSKHTNESSTEMMWKMSKSLKWQKNTSTQFLSTAINKSPFQGPVISQRQGIVPVVYNNLTIRVPGSIFNFPISDLTDKNK